MDLVVKIALGVALGAVLFFGGCVLLIGFALSGKDDAPATRGFADPTPTTPKAAAAIKDDTPATRGFADPTPTTPKAAAAIQEARLDDDDNAAILAEAAGEDLAEAIQAAQSPIGYMDDDYNINPLPGLVVARAKSPEVTIALADTFGCQWIEASYDAIWRRGNGLGHQNAIIDIGNAMIMRAGGQITIRTGDVADAWRFCKQSRERREMYEAVRRENGLPPMSIATPEPPPLPSADAAAAAIQEAQEHARVHEAGLDDDDNAAILAEAAGEDLAEAIQAAQSPIGYMDDDYNINPLPGLVVARAKSPEVTIALADTFGCQWIEASYDAIWRRGNGLGHQNAIIDIGNAMIMRAGGQITIRTGDVADAWRFCKQSRERREMYEAVRRENGLPPIPIVTPELPPLQSADDVAAAIQEAQERARVHDNALGK